MQHIPDSDAAEREKMMADRMKRADMVFDRLLLLALPREVAAAEEGWSSDRGAPPLAAASPANAVL